MSSPLQVEEPRLPPELERDIFETAASLDDRTRRDILLVAKRVCKWVEPLIYRVVIKCSQGFGIPKSSPSLMQLNLHNITPRDIRKGSFCRSLLLQGIGVDEAIGILSICPNAIDLAIWVLLGDYTPIGKILQSMKIQRLSIKLTEMLHSSPRFFNDVPLAQTMTHLDLIEVSGVFWDDAWKQLLHLPRLTHLALDGGNILPSIEGMLQESESVELVVATSMVYPYDPYVDDDSDSVETPERTANSGNDPRFVHIPYPESPVACWLRGANGGEDMWIKAKRAQYEKIEQRKHEPATPSDTLLQALTLADQ